MNFRFKETNRIKREAEKKKNKKKEKKRKEKKKIEKIELEIIKHEKKKKNIYISVIPFFCEQKTPFSHRLSKVTRYVTFARFFIFWNRGGCDL